jgi:YfiH family protein
MSGRESGDQHMQHGFFKVSAIPVKHAFFSRNWPINREYKDVDYRLGGNPIEETMANRNRAAGQLGYQLQDLKLVTQKHGNRVHIVRSQDEKITEIEADALVTDVTGVLVAVLTADCCPILLYASKPNGAPIVAAVHAGWRGAFAGVITNTVNVMHEMGAQDIQAAIGPTIAQKSYEVDKDFHRKFLGQSPQNQSFFVPNGPEHFLFDLVAYNKQQLRSLKITTIADLAVDTYSKPEEYFSYRRSCHEQKRLGLAKPIFGCQISCIGI